MPGYYRNSKAIDVDSTEQPEEELSDEVREEMGGTIG
jgi:hypothetical protein